MSRKILQDDGKTRRRIRRLEQICMEEINSESPCSRFKIKKSGSLKCNNCWINKDFEELVGLPMEEFYE